MSLVEIWHTCHVHHALEAIRDGELRARLIYDQSKLNQHRYTVVWLSPNDWTNAGGSRYGNVNFNFDWASLTEGMHAFWVEVAAYSPQAPRILLTADPDAIPDGLTPYDATCGDGPWWHDLQGDKHYWNGDYTLEVMVGQSLNLDNVTSIDFSNHHSNRCCLDPKSCPDRGTVARSGRDRFFGGLILTNTLVKHPGLFVVNGGPNDQVVAWANDVFVRTHSVEPSGQILASDSTAAALAREFLGYYYRRPRSDFKAMRNETASWFKDGDELWAACSTVIDDFFNLEPGKISSLIL